MPLHSEDLVDSREVNQNRKESPKLAARMGKKEAGPKEKIKIKNGMRFGRLVAIERSSKVTKDCGEWWICRCDCGSIICVRKYGIVRDGKGSTKSCGCKHRDSVSSHGKSSAPEYNVWAGMKKRCGNPSHKSYKDYGGRGIKVCDRWLHSFENFYADMGPRPSKLHTLERTNNNLGYSPDNCSWQPMSVQAVNRRSNRFIVVNGQSKTLSQWSRFTGVGITTLHRRLKNGWGEDRAITQPVCI